ncbi:hypothetical protein [Nocardia sp. BMG51109]|uniref:hypothetical protein n=1 Tax=Nocardia sp. BMG51109 TaxID=1056816 RepID=UPI0004644CC8|nr:hypothetical protein [Nocardia sp. BMG51109]
MRDNAVGLIRSDLSEDVAADEKAIRELAEWSDLEFAEGLVFDAATDMPTLRLIEAVHRAKAQVVIVPTAAHLGGGRRALEELDVSVLCSKLARPVTTGDAGASAGRPPTGDGPDAA